MTAADLIAHLRLEPLPTEGGYFRETYRSAEVYVSLPRYAAARPFATAIYYLLTAEPDSFSAMHRLQTDEIYHFYLGDPVQMLLLYPDGHSEIVVLGQNILAGEQVQYVIPRGVWQGSRLIAGGSFALLGTTMSPGFDPADFELGVREDLARSYPESAALIAQLTR